MPQQAETLKTEQLSQKHVRNTTEFYHNKAICTTLILKFQGQIKAILHSYIRSLKRFMHLKYQVTHRSRDVLRVHKNLVE